jgi:hypothetical protein
VLSDEDSHLKVIISAEKRPTGQHKGRYNAPTSNEVAVLMCGSEHGARDIVLRYRDSNVVRIKETHRSYDPLQYPLLFPIGTDGYSHPEKHEHGTYKVTCRQFYAHRLMVRSGDDNNTILRARRLFQQFCVDSYAKVETERLDFIRREQTLLRADQYGILKDAIEGAYRSHLLAFN